MKGNTLRLYTHILRGNGDSVGVRDVQKELGLGRDGKSQDKTSVLAAESRRFSHYIAVKADKATGNLQFQS